MRRVDGMLTFGLWLALVVATSGTAMALEDRPPEVPSAAERSAAAMAGPSRLNIIDVTADRLAREPLTDEQYQQTVAEVGPAITRYFVAGLGDDEVERIVELARLAGRLHASDPRAAAAMIDIATLLYRYTWSRTKSDHPTLYRRIEAFIRSGDYDRDDLSLAMWSLGDEGVIGVIDLCVWKDDTYTVMGQPPDSTICEDNGGRQIRADFRGLGWDEVSPQTIDQKGPKRASRLLSTVAREMDGVGIHTVVQDTTANDKLGGERFRTAWAEALAELGPTLAVRRRIGPQAPPERRVIEMVLAAREADGAGDARAAAAFMALALADYRSAVPEDAQTGAINAAIDALVGDEYAGLPGLELYAPEGSADYCLRPDGTCERIAGRDTHWECAGAELTLTRMTFEDAEAAGCRLE